MSIGYHYTNVMVTLVYTLVQRTHHYFKFNIAVDLM